MLYLDLKFLHFLQNKLDGFTPKKDNVWVMRCPICGDSKINKNKKRGYIYAWKNKLMFSCHNCGESHTFKNFLKLIDPYLYDQYRLEHFKEVTGTTYQPVVKKETTELQQPANTHEDKFAKLKKEKTIEDIFYEICPSLDTLPKDNPAVSYCIERKIPSVVFKRLFYIDDTKKLLQIQPDLDIKFSEKRLVLPFFDKCGKLIGLTCRSLAKNTKLRYLTVKLSETSQVFGMDNVDPTKTIYVLEGPIDSLFIPNAIAVTGTAFGKVESILSELNIARDQVVLICDNQPRNKELVKIQEKLINNGFSVVVWDVDDSLGKDVNSLIQDSGMSPMEVFSIIKRSVCRGMSALMKFNQWKKC